MAWYNLSEHVEWIVISGIIWMAFGLSVSQVRDLSLLVMLLLVTAPFLLIVVAEFNAHFTNGLAPMGPVAWHPCGYYTLFVLLCWSCLGLGFPICINSERPSILRNIVFVCIVVASVLLWWLPAFVREATDSVILFLVSLDPQPYEAVVPGPTSDFIRLCPLDFRPFDVSMTLSDFGAALFLASFLAFALWYLELRKSALKAFEPVEEHSIALFLLGCLLLPFLSFTGFEIRHILLCLAGVAVVSGSFSLQRALADNQ